MVTAEEFNGLSPTPGSPGRVVSLDAFRGLVMLLMVSDGFGLAEVAQRSPDSQLWRFLARQADHVRWQGCSLWDLIMPAFLFIVGAALPYSIAGRRRKGHSWGRMFAHAIWRSVMLVALGIIVMSDASRRTEFSFINVLAQIGLGYWLVFLLVDRSAVVQFFVVIGILAGYWYWFYQYPLPGPGFEYVAVGVPSNWPHLRGITAHWDLNSNPAAAFDRWFLNLFPRSEPFRYRAGGGTTLNFIPSIATMLLGVMAGQFLLGSRPEGQKGRCLILAATIVLIAGVALDPAILPGVDSTQWTLCPIVKRIWTPSWVLYSAGWVMLGLAALYWLIDVKGWRRWTFPLVVVGMNSLVVYLLAALAAPWIRRTFRIHLGDSPFEGTCGPIVELTCVLLVLWLFSVWLYHRRIFIRL